MSNQRIIKTIEFKLYLNAEQEATLSSWLRTCCWVYNQALEHRIKAYKRRGQSVSRYDQDNILTGWRLRMDSVRAVPLAFERGALNRLDRGMQAFFRRCKSKENPGFPRFRSYRHYNSLEYLCVGKYIGDGTIRIPLLGHVNARGRFDNVIGKQKLLRVVRRASGWYAQVIVDQGQLPELMTPQTVIGIDVGLNSFVTLSNGETIENPRFYRKSESRLSRLQRNLARKKKGSINRKNAIRKLNRQYERVASQRKVFCHQESRNIVNNFDFIAFEKLNIDGLMRTSMSKSVRDAAWGLFFFFVTYKAANAGKLAVAVDPRGTSQECPACGAVRKKSRKERTHLCPCGAFLDRDHSAALVVLARAARSSGLVLPVEGLASTGRRACALSSKPARRSRKSKALRH